jgi:PAS domain S-box-containing protein
MGFGQKDRFEQLRQKAENLIKNRNLEEGDEEASPDMLDVDQLIHELRVHQNELEVQNEELRQAHEEIASLHREYHDLYEYAPCGYVTLSPEGVITRINQNGVRLLGKEQSRVQNFSFIAFVAPRSKTEYHRILQQAQEIGEKHNCELELLPGAGESVWVQTDIKADYDQAGGLKQWRFTLVDITERKQAEEKQKRLAYSLNERVKELHCLYGLSKIVEKENTTLEDIYQGLVEIIPSAWQYPDVTCAQLTAGDREFKTENYRETEWQLSSTITVHDTAYGELTVGYLSEKPQADHGPFLEEEKVLLHSLCERLGRIIERFQAEEELRKSEQRYRELFNSALVGIVLHDAEGNIISANKKAEEVFGIEEKELKKKELDFWKGKLLHPDGSQMKISEFPLAISARSKMPSEGLIIGLSMAEQHNTKWLVAGARPVLNVNGEVEKTLITFIDITEQKQAEDTVRDSEKRYRELVETIQEGLWLIDKDGFTTFVNPKMAEMLGYTVEEMQGKHLFVFMDSEAQEYARKLLSRRESGVKEQHEFTFTKKSGDTISTLIETTPLYDEAGNYNGALAGIIEITRLKEAERELIVAKERAEEADRLKSSFLSSMSHEIRTPLNAIIGFIDIVLEEDTISKELQEYLGKAKESGNMLLMLINDILDFSKIEANQLTLEQRSFSLKALLDNVDAIGRVLIQEREKNIQPRRVFSENLDIYLDGDEYRLEQVLINLISNAVKFTESGFIEYGVTLKDETTLEFYVRDTGIGIAEEKQKHIFEPFRQAEEKTTRKYGGTGLGLSISKRLVEKMGGEIHLRSTLGEGSTFYFTIPCVRGKATTQEAETAHQEVGPSDVKKILVAEDNQINQLVIQKMLERLGYEVVVAHDGRDAVSLLKSDPDIDLILMDMYMPHLDGIETTTVVRRMEDADQDHRIPIIALTAAAGKEEKDRMLEAGCDDYLVKPLQRDVLVEVLKKYCQ